MVKSNVFISLLLTQSKQGSKQHHSNAKSYPILTINGPIGWLLCTINNWKQCKVCKHYKIRGNEISGLNENSLHAILTEHAAKVFNVILLQ